jgi:hypothetical protein
MLIETGYGITAFRAVESYNKKRQADDIVYEITNRGEEV